MERTCYKDLKNAKNIKNGARNHLLLSLKNEETLAMVSLEISTARGRRMADFSLHFPFLLILLPKDQNALLTKLPTFSIHAHFCPKT